MSKPTLFELLAQPRPTIGPGIWDGISARMAETAGFSMAFLSGYGLSASLLGKPDFGLVTQSQMVDAAERICASVALPIIVDIDTGYGGPFNVEQTVESLVRSGAAGCFLEDQIFPKRCGHMNHKRVVDTDEYLPKLRAALRSRKDAAFHVTARTDARAVLGLEEAIRRAQLYRDEGADAVFVEAPQSVEELRRIREQVPDVTLVANMVEQGKTPLLRAQELYALGYSLVAVPVAGLLHMAAGLRRLWSNLAKDGWTKASAEEMLTFGAFNDLIGLDTLYAREREWMTAQT
jgi:2-methylisocitrate lyase-like PEP mutase family enzyme